MESLSAPPANTDNTKQRTGDAEVRIGTMYGFSAYTAMGLLPLYFHMLVPATSLEILAHRIIWSLIFCLGLGMIKGDFQWVGDVLRNPRQLGLVSLAALLLTTNWIIFIYGVTSGNVVETALGEFIIPLLVILLAVVFLQERLGRLQWCAIALGAVAVLIISFEYGRLPWIALSLAMTFSLYVLVKKNVGPNVGALQGMTIETAIMCPFAVAATIWIERSGQGTFTTEGSAHALMLVGTGIVTASPLILFASAARRVPLVTMGSLQFLVPVLQFVSGVLILNEDVPPGRWVGFGVVWVALTVLTIDAYRNARHGDVQSP